MILAEGRGSELVREGGISDDVFSAIIPALSRTSSLPCPPGRSQIYGLIGTFVKRRASRR
ncbi:hypothetical protein CCL14_26105 [Pseudomonas syringae]|nr:hypothetical protein CCL14_26105 [Pseudomonas syringae]PBP47552.1 hypothetical protein CCL13_08370 [Pseudomonas syringae]PBP79613.1 hypothetical protein CCL20_23995 [Pseudomonas syringae]